MSVTESEIRSLLDCQYLETVAIQTPAPGFRPHVLWVDEEGFLREPFVYPTFTLPFCNGGQPMAGYGLITGTDHYGNIANCQLDAAQVAPHLQIEPWQQRIEPDQVLTQVFRVYAHAAPLAEP